jgi:hypothetical protein
MAASDSLRHLGAKDLIGTVETESHYLRLRRCLAPVARRRQGHDKAARLEPVGALDHIDASSGSNSLPRNAYGRVHLPFADELSRYLSSVAEASCQD